MYSICLYISDLFHIYNILHVQPCYWKVQDFIFFIGKQYAIMCVYQIFFIHLFVNEHLGGFIILAIVSNAAVNFWVHEAVQISVFIFFWYIHRSGISASHGGGSFSFIETSILFSTVVVPTYIPTNMYEFMSVTVYGCMRITFSPHSCQNLLLVFILMIIILIGVKWCLIVVFTYISVMINNVEHLFMCFLAICSLPCKNVSSDFLSVF